MINFRQYLAQAQHAALMMQADYRRFIKAGFKHVAPNILESPDGKTIVEFD